MLINKPGVYALVNEKSKMVLIQASNDVVKHLGSNVASLAKRVHANKQLRVDRKYLNFKLLEHCESSHKDILKLKWIHHYQQLGYTLYNTEKLPQYKIRRRLVTSDEPGRKLMCQVQLVSGGKRVVAVKEFDTDLEAKEFMNTTSLYDMLKMIK